MPANTAKSTLNRSEFVVLAQAGTQKTTVLDPRLRADDE